MQLCSPASYKPLPQVEERLALKQRMQLITTGRCLKLGKKLKSDLRWNRGCNGKLTSVCCCNNCWLKSDLRWNRGCNWSSMYWPFNARVVEERLALKQRMQPSEFWFIEALIYLLKSDLRWNRGCNTLSPFSVDSIAYCWRATCAETEDATLRFEVCCITLFCVEERLALKQRMQQVKCQIMAFYDKLKSDLRWNRGCNFLPYG